VREKQWQTHEGRNPNPLFDTDWYLKRYPDVTASHMDPLTHFIQHGASEGRNPNPLFDTDWYLKRYPNVAASGINPLEDFIQHGASEGRDPNPLFDTDWYLKRYPDVALAKVNWLEHFIYFGMKELRKPGPLYDSLSFDTSKNLIPDITVDALNETSIAFPRVTIVIPVYGQWYLTERCLIALARTEASYLAKIVVVNDKSPDNTLEKLKLYPKIEVHDLEHNLGFTLASNSGANGATSEYLLFLNNDTEPLPGFLDALLEVADNHLDVAIVGSRLIFPNGLLQEAGSIIWQDGSGHNYGRGEHADGPEYQMVREVDYCSGASLLVRNDFFISTGGFDSRYAPAYYEDVDLAFTARELGFRVVVAPRSVVIHHEGGSHGTNISTGVKASQVVNHKKFFQKWSKTLELQPRQQEVPLRVAANRAKNINPILLFIDHDFITPDKDAGSLRSKGIMNACVELGYRIVFVADSPNLFGEPANDLRDESILVLGSQNDFQDFITEQYASVAAIFIARVEVAFKWLPQIESTCPEIPVIFDTVDLHHLRVSQHAKVINSQTLAMTASGIKRRELHVIKNTSATLVVNPKELGYLKNILPAASIFHLGLIYDLRDQNTDWSSRKGLSFIANFGHLPNVDGLAWFIDYIWPLLDEDLRGDGLRVIGLDPPRELLDRKQAGIEFLGYVPNTSIYLQQTRVSIAPLRFGAGSKGKVCEAWANGLPVVGTSVALAGMIEDSNDAYLVADSPSDFASMISMIYGNEQRWNSAQRGSSQILKRDYSSRSAKDRLEHVLGAVGIIGVEL
jgi:GT2 family glycosyltransferase